MIKELAKKNISLIGFLVFSLVVSVFFLFMAIVKSGTIQTCQKDINTQKEEIAKLRKLEPAPLPENEKMINDDANDFTARLSAFRMIFGKPYRIPLQAFTEKLRLIGKKAAQESPPAAKGVQDETPLATELAISQASEKLELTEQDILEKWKEIYLKEAKSNPNAILEKFLSQFDADTVSDAKEVFIEKVRSSSVEPINGENVNKYILEALGISREMTREACREYIDIMGKKISALLLDKTIGKGVTLTCEDKQAFVVVGEGIPDLSLIPSILRNYRIIEDIVFFLKRSGVTNLKTFKRLSTIEGSEEKGFLVYTYQMTLVGDIDTVRDFINTLNGAYLENHVFIIRDLKLSKSYDEATVLPIVPMTASTKKNEKDESVFKAEVSKDLSAMQNVPKYVPILGMSKDIVVEMLFDYVIYTGDQPRKVR